MRLVTATDNEHFFEFARRVHNYARRLIYFVYMTESGEEQFFADQQNKVTNEHDQIIEAVRMHDREQLINIMMTHAERFRTRLLRYINGRWQTAADVSNAISSVLPSR